MPLNRRAKWVHWKSELASKRLSPGETPGERATRENPMGPVGRIAELQNLATFLLADGCKWLTGQTITLDGGAESRYRLQLLCASALDRCAMASGARRDQGAERKGPPQRAV
jgi:hypothetical protein